MALEAFPDRSAVQVAEQIGCSLSYAQKIHNQDTAIGILPVRDRVTGKDGKSYPASYQKSEHPKLAKVKELLLAGDVGRCGARCGRVEGSSGRRGRSRPMGPSTGSGGRFLRLSVLGCILRADVHSARGRPGACGSLGARRAGVASPTSL